MQKKTIIIDIEAMFENELETLAESNYPQARREIYFILKALKENYRILVYTKGLIALGAMWCIKQGFDTQLDGVVNRKYRCFLHINRKI